MNIVLFEDPQVSRLAPLAVLRPMYAVSCAGFRLLDLLQELTQVTLHGSVRSHLRRTQADFLPPSPPDTSRPTLYLNARLVPDARMLKTVEAWRAASEPFRIVADEATIAAFVPAGTATLQDMDESLASALAGQPWPTRTAEDTLRLFNYPHEVIVENARLIRLNLEFRLASGRYEEIQDGVFAAGKTDVAAPIAFDVANGPVVLEAGVSMGPFSVVKGPTYLGADSIINPQSFLKGNVSLGDHCKIGGELSQTVIESYCNKVHFGYLGTSYVGQWVNLGAGTTNSNLKNTYGTVRVQYGEQKIDTGMQFLGCLIGDYSKTAIHTSIYTGKIIGICSNVYGVVTQNVPSFSNYAQSFGEVTEHPPAVMEVSQQRIFSRRGIEQRPCDIQLIRDAYALESPKRSLADHPPTF